MKTMVLEVLPREEKGKGAARKLRREGLVPAVIYGSQGTRKLAIRSKDLTQILKSEGGSNAILEVTIGGEKRTALLKDVQYDMIRRVPIHADIFEVSMDQQIRVMVEIKPVGEGPKGLKEGGILTHTLTEVEVECLPGEIPSSFEVDLSHLEVGDTFHVSDIPVQGLDILTPGDQVLFTVVAPTVEKEPEEVEVEAEGAEEAAAAEGEGGEKPSESDETSTPKE